MVNLTDTARHCQTGCLGVAGAAGQIGQLVVLGGAPNWDGRGSQKSRTHSRLSGGAGMAGCMGITTKFD